MLAYLSVRVCRRRAFASMALAVLAMASAVVGCDGHQPEMTSEEATAVAVTVAPAAYKDVSPSLGFTGRVEAVDTVNLRARVQGFLEDRRFAEGAHVNKGDILFVIEKEPFETAVAAAEGALARAEAEAMRAEKDRMRYEELVAEGNISRQQYDQAFAAELAAKAEVKTARARLDRAKLDLTYTEIIAPIDGRIGRSIYSIGNLVGPDSGVLATIVSEDPVYVTFPVSQRLVLEYQQRAREKGPESILVKLNLANGSPYTHEGRIDFADIQVSQSTDTLTLRATFPNPRQLLIDGQFVSVNVQREEPQKAVVISQAAVQADQAGIYVLVVNGENKIEVRRIDRGEGGAEGELVVQSGLAEGDLVVIEGMQKVRPDQIVEASVREASASGVSTQ